MKKRKRVIVVLLATMMLVTACTNEDSKVKESLTGFLESMRKFDLENMGGYVVGSDQDKIFKEEDLEDDQTSKIFLNYFKENASKIEYSIKDIEVKKDKASAKVEFKYVDGGNIYKYTLADLMKEAFSMALVDEGLVDEKLEDAMAKILDENRKNMEEEYSNKTMEFNLSKTDGKWLIDQLDDGVMDVLTSNFLTVLNEFDDGLGELEGGELDEEDREVIVKNIGDEIELTEYKLKVTTVEETEEIVGDGGEKTKSKEDSKFVVLGLDIVNTGKKGISFSNDLVLRDKESREYRSYSDSIGGLKNYMDQRELAPSIKESGLVCFEVPDDSSGYSLFIEDNDSLYEIPLR